VSDGGKGLEKYIKYLSAGLYRIRTGLSGTLLRDFGLHGRLKVRENLDDSKILRKISYLLIQYADTMYSAVLWCRTFNVDSYGQWHILLAYGTKQGTEMYQPVNSVCHHDLLQSLKVQYVSEYIRT
jgi:hypothetical protein